MNSLQRKTLILMVQSAIEVKEKRELSNIEIRVIENMEDTILKQLVNKLLA